MQNQYVQCFLQLDKTILRTCFSQDGTASSAPLDNEFLSRLIKMSDISVSAGTNFSLNVTALTFK